LSAIRILLTVFQIPHARGFAVDFTRAPGSFVVGGKMVRVAKDRLDAVRRYLHQVFPDWALAESWDDDREAQNFLLKKPREPLHLLKVSRSVLDQFGPRKLAGLLEGHQVANALRRADKHRLLLTQRGLDKL